MSNFITNSELRIEAERLCDENEKLRELVSDMMRFFEDGNYCAICEKAADCEHAQDIYDIDCLMRSVFRHRMQNLGVVVDE